MGSSAELLCRKMSRDDEERARADGREEKGAVVDTSSPPSAARSLLLGFPFNHINLACLDPIPQSLEIIVSVQLP